MDLDRERITCVFALGGGELHEPNPLFPDEWDGPPGEGIAYWYDGPPEYATELRDADHIPCPACGGKGVVPDGEVCEACEGPGYLLHEVRTAILCGLFGLPDPPPGWERIASFSTSGEASCWSCAEGGGDGTGNEGESAGCPLCEGEGYVYIGDGWAEVVLRKMT